eukprot:3458053-Amphidinium_carterae.1
MQVGIKRKFDEMHPQAVPFEGDLLEWLKDTDGVITPSKELKRLGLPVQLLNRESYKECLRAFEEQVQEQSWDVLIVAGSPVWGTDEIRAYARKADPAKEEQTLLNEFFISGGSIRFYSMPDHGKS